MQQSAWLFCIALLLTLLPTGGAVRGQAVLPFERDRLEIQQELELVLPLDLDGDGGNELIVVEADRGKARDVPYTVAVFLNVEGKYVALPSARALLPRHVSLIAAARFHGGPALAMLVPGEVVLWPWRGDRFAPESARRFALSGSIFPVVNGEPSEGPRWVADLTGDGSAELLVPRFDGIDVLDVDESGALRLRARLRYRSEARMLNWFRRDLVAYELPALFAQQVDGRSWQDLVLYLDGQLWVFVLDDSLQGGERSPVLYMDLQPPRPFDPAEPRDPPQRLVSATDLDEDGHFDLIFSKNSATDSQFNTRTTVLIHYGQAAQDGRPIAFQTTPDQVYVTEGFTLPLVLDVNADGRTDLVMVNAEIGVWTVIKALITRSVSAEAAFYLTQAEGRLPRDPQYLESYTVTFALGRYSHRPFAEFGDFNGDGLPDLLLARSSDTIGLHWGRKDRVWSNDPDETIEDFVPIQGKRLQIVDLDQDGRDDLLLVYDRDDIRQMPEVNRRFTVLRSRFGTPRSKGDARSAAQR